jgi:hypothetical protein
MNAHLSSVPAASDADSGSLMVDQNLAQGNSRLGLSNPQQCHVGQGLTDSQREAAIQRAAALIEKYMGIWKAEGCFAARGDADRARRLMELLIKGRSPEMVAKLERERGLS